MTTFAVLADPVRRRLVEELAGGARTAGELCAVGDEVFGISQPAVSNQLRRLRDGGLVTVRADGSSRVYELRPGALDEVTAWVDRYARLWPGRLEALETELARERRRSRPPTPGSDSGAHA